MIAYGETEYKFSDTQDNSVAESLLEITYTISEKLKLSGTIVDGDNQDYYTLNAGIVYSLLREN